MNSQFKNSNLGFYLYAFLIVIIASAVIFVFWYMYWGYKLGTYEEGTMLGSVYIGGLREEDIEPTMETRIDKWKGDETILFEVTYQGYTYVYDRESFYFNIKDSITNIVNGSENQLDVGFISGAREELIADLNSLPFLEEIDNANIDFDLLIADMVKDASYMKSFSQKQIEKYIIDDTLSYEELGSISVYVPNGVNIDDLMDSVASKQMEYEDGRIMIPSKYLFDITNELGDVLEDNELTVLSTAILGLILETNFSINEVHYENKVDLVNYTLETYPCYGHNTKVFEREDESFSFYNPNNAYFYLLLEKEDVNHMNVKLYGLPFEDEITVDIVKTTIDFSQKIVTSGEDHDGLPGKMVEVYRRIYDIEGEIIFDRVVNFEFYPPEVQIIVSP